MFRIHNIDELRRLNELLRSMDNDTITFPIDIFRTDAEVSAPQFGNDHMRVYVYTKKSGDVEIESSEDDRGIRSVLLKAEREFESSYGIGGEGSA